ncbi:MAG TPA: metal-dependent hydrolase, partial [Acinetobacter lwoffii]|nr:metal-dependent hydrolase [Acinetobacter lwoffii]
VAYDVFEGVFGKGSKSYLLRTSSLVAAMVTLFFVHSYFILRLLKEDQHLNISALKDIYIFGYSPSKGIIAGMTKEMLMYFKPGFHPNDLDSRSLLTSWKQKLGL